MSKKLTKKDHFNTLLNLPEVQANETLIEFITHELELLDRKNSAEKKPTTQQTANAGLKDAIYEAMEPGRLYTITDLIKEVHECADLTNQRVSALVRQMIPELVERIEDKRKAYFKAIK